MYSLLSALPGSCGAFTHKIFSKNFAGPEKATGWQELKICNFCRVWNIHKNMSLRGNGYPPGNHPQKFTIFAGPDMGMTSVRTRRDTGMTRVWVRGAIRGWQHFVKTSCCRRVLLKIRGVGDGCGWFWFLCFNNFFVKKKLSFYGLTMEPRS